MKRWPMFFSAPLWLGFLLFEISYAEDSCSDAGLRIAGAEEIVFNWQKDACDERDLPDMPARAFRDADGGVQLLATNRYNRRMTGPDLNHQKRDCRIIMPSHNDPDPAKFNDNEWICGVYTHDGKTIYALIHDEYHGWEHGEVRPSKRNADYWYNAITLGRSTDMGVSYTHDEAPAHLVASIPYKYDPGTGPVGIFAPTNIIARDGYYYALFHTDNKYKLVPPHAVGIMRTRQLADPASWRAWDGEGFNIRFINPYLEPDARPEEHIFKPILSDMGASSITFNTALNLYILVGVGHVKDPATGRFTRGFCYAFSNDLIHWCNPRLLMPAPTNPVKYKSGDPDPIAYPSFLDPASDSRNFETTGKKFYLYYTHFNFSRSHKGNWHADRDLVRIPVEAIEKADNH